MPAATLRGGRLVYSALSSKMISAPTVGVEEEFQILDPGTRELHSGAPVILPHLGTGPQVQAELYQSMIETATPVCQTLADVRRELTDLRRSVISAAAAEGYAIAAGGTHPFSHWDDQALTPADRYERTAIDYQQMGRELLIHGCHVHVGVPDAELRVQVMNRVRVWLAPMLALTVNSPFWLGRDTGYASFRAQVWGRFPISGAPGLFASRAEYEEFVQLLIATHSVGDPSRLYWDVRLPPQIPTIEFRAADVCLTVDEAVMAAGLARALVQVCADQAWRGEPYPLARFELVRAARWRAARYGLEEELLDLYTGESLPARVVVDRLLAFVRPALDDWGEWDEIAALVADTFARGTGAARQRAAFARSGWLTGVVDYLVEETGRGL